VLVEDDGRTLAARAPKGLEEEVEQNSPVTVVNPLMCIDSSGISLIFDAAARMKNRRQQLRLVVAPKSFVSEVLAAVSMSDSVPIDPEVDQAVRAATASP
jgi:hypothetical protein